MDPNTPLNVIVDESQTMLGKLDQFKWTSNGGSNRDLAFIIILLAFCVILTAKLAPYYQTQHQSAVYNKIQTTPSIPKTILNQLGLNFMTSYKENTVKAPQQIRGMTHVAQTGGNHSSVLERPLFDGQSVIVKVRSLNPFSSNDMSQSVEVQVIESATHNSSETDFSPAIRAKLIGTALPNFSTKRLYISFTELISVEGRSYTIQGQAVDSENLSTGIDGNYSSGLSTRLFGVAIDRAIMAADQAGTAYLFSAIGPNGTGTQQLRSAAMDAAQQASQNISAETTKRLRETKAEITLPAGSIFFVRLQAKQQGNHL